MKKYRILKDQKLIIDHPTQNRKVTLYRIQALKDFDNVKKGDLGGWIEKESNLSQDGNCWIYGEAKQFDYSIRFDNAKSYDKAMSFGYSRQFDNSKQFGNSKQFEHSIQYGYSKQFGNSKQYGCSKQFGNSRQFNNSKQFGHSQQYESSKQFGNSKQFGFSKQFGNSKQFGFSMQYGYSQQYGDSKQYEYSDQYKYSQQFGNSKQFGDSKMFDHHYQFTGKNNLDITKMSRIKAIKYNIKIQLGEISIFDNYIILYKRVNKINDKTFKSLYDPNFIYRVGRISKVENYDKNPSTSCGAGIHLSIPTYWRGGNALIACKVYFRDIISVQEGKIRAKKCKTIKEIEDYLIS